LAGKSFRDPIHGFIDVDPLELKIINSMPFQRLRHIRQLGTSYLVYHGAEHTRFGHSLGVMHLVSKAFNSALTNYIDRYGRPLFDADTSNLYRRILRIIALVHDLGHPPFSHAGEGVFVKGLKHEHFTKRILFETEIADIIRESGDITPELIWLIYGEKDTVALKDPTYKMPEFKFLKGFMDSDIDCDKMDYLLRDSYYCGVNYGKYDVNRLIDSLNIYQKNNIIQLAVERGGLHAFEEFVIARYFMFIQVYFHKTRRFLDFLLTSLLKDILTEPITDNFPLDQYLARNDGFILNDIYALKDEGKQNAIDFLDRKIMCCVYETPSQSVTADKDNFNIIYNSVKAYFKDTKFIFDSADKLATEIPVIGSYNADEGKGIPILTKHSPVPRDLPSESNLLSGLYLPISIRRIYAGRDRADVIEEYIHEMQKSEEEPQ